MKFYITKGWVGPELPEDVTTYMDVAILAEEKCRKAVDKNLGRSTIVNPRLEKSPSPGTIRRYHRTDDLLLPYEVPDGLINILATAAVGLSSSLPDNVKKVYRPEVHVERTLEGYKVAVGLVVDFVGRDSKKEQ